MLSFEDIEACMPDGANAAIDDNGNETGYTFVSAQWMHDFAHAVAEKERVACELRCAKTKVLVAGRHDYTALNVQAIMMAAISERSNG